MTDPTEAALREALDDEYKARATYAKVIETFGAIRPFINIVEAENRHASALLRQFDRLGLTPPEDRWTGRIKAPSSVAAACEEAVQAEIENAAMYKRLLDMVEDDAVRNVLLNLQDASQSRHLPAFRRCLERRRDRE
jgi:rubrerythrin